MFLARADQTIGKQWPFAHHVGYGTTKKCHNISELVFKKKTSFVCKSVVRILFFDYFEYSETSEE